MNVVLFPLFTLFAFVLIAPLENSQQDFYQFVLTVWFMNAVLLIFNLLPVYPLDGGQILRGLLWLKVGPIRSLKSSSVIGFGGAILFAWWAFAAHPSGWAYSRSSFSLRRGRMDTNRTSRIRGGRARSGIRPAYSCGS